MTLSGSVNFQSLIRTVSVFPVVSMHYGFYKHTYLSWCRFRTIMQQKNQLQQQQSSRKKRKQGWIPVFVQMSCSVLYLSSLRQGATAVGSAAAVHNPVARLEQTLAQRAPKVPSPKDTQQLLLRGSCCAQRTQRHALWLHLPRHAAQSVSRHSFSLTQTVKISPVNKALY